MAVYLAYAGVGGGISLVFMPDCRHGKLDQFRRAVSSSFAETKRRETKPQNAGGNAAFLAFLPVLRSKTGNQPGRTLNGDFFLGGGRSTDRTNLAEPPTKTQQSCYDKNAAALTPHAAIPGAHASAIAQNHTKTAPLCVLGSHLVCVVCCSL